MGLETTCTVRHKRAKWDAKVLLETDELRVRGEKPLRIPFSQITRVDAKDGALHVEWAGDAVVFEVGSAAETWAKRIRSPRSLLDKLGVKAGDEVVTVGTVDAGLLSELATRATIRSARSATTIPQGASVIVLHAADRDALAALAPLSRRMARDGCIWVVHPKGKNGLADTVIFAAGKDAGLTATKVARVSDTLTAEKLVIPKSAR
jgi:hypothetical protein